MGANEKHEAAMHGHTPTTQDVREEYRNGRQFGEIYSKTDFRAEFDRWLAAVRSEAKAEAVAEVASAFQYKAWAELIQGNMQQRLRIAQPITDWLRARAEQYKEGK